MDLGVCNALFYNKHYYVPYNLNTMFIGHDDIIQEMYKECLPKGFSSNRDLFCMA